MNIIWDMSNKCNLECRHCGAWNLMKNSENLTRKQMTDIANNMTAIADSVSLLGGEPLLAIGIDEVCDIFMENGVAIDLITNGQIYNQSIENLLRKKNVQNIYVSIDGLENDNDEIRGYGSWKKSINFLHRILEFKSASKKVGVTMVLTKTSIRQLEKFMEYFNEFDIDVISFNLLDISGNAVTYKEELFLDDSTILKTLEVIASMQDDLNYQIVINSGSSTVDRYLRNKTGYVQENAQYECDALYGSAYCDMNGFFTHAGRIKGRE